MYLLAGVTFCAAVTGTPVYTILRHLKSCYYRLASFKYAYEQMKYFPTC
jgi:hypothetical protein